MSNLPRKKCMRSCRSTRSRASRARNSSIPTGGMALLGRALMNKTGKDYESIIAERLCGPLDMTSTRVALTPELRSRLAMGHEKDGKQTLPWKLDAYQPAGAILSTANDLLKYAAAQAGLTPSKLSASISQSHIIRHTDL